MMTRQEVQQANRMIENQHLAAAKARELSKGSFERAKLELLAIYSNLTANELVKSYCPCGCGLRSV